jgi:hypothetical protein
MRQIISTAVVAVVVGAVAGATMGAMAQPGPEAPAQQAIVPAVTSINAHKVDGRHAVSASASRKKRSGKLVATNKQGYLPNNIIKPAWHLIGGKPPVLADDQVAWGEVAGMPAGFVDGVDDVGVTKVKVKRVESLGNTVANGVWSTDFVTCPSDTVVVGGGGWTNDGSGKIRLTDSFSDGNGWRVYFENLSGNSRRITAVAHCLSVEPAARLEVAGKRRAAVPASKRR